MIVIPVMANCRICHTAEKDSEHECLPRVWELDLPDGVEAYRRPDGRLVYRDRNVLDPLLDRLDEEIAVEGERRYRRRSRVWVALTLVPVPLVLVLPFALLFGLPPSAARLVAALPFAVAAVTGAGMLYLAAGALAARTVWTLVPLSAVAGAGFAFGLLVDLGFMGALGAFLILVLMEVGVYQTVKDRRLAQG